MSSPKSVTSNGSEVINGNGVPTAGVVHNKKALPEIFTDPGWGVLGTSILSTSNCGNPALRLFGFGPVAADGYGIGYIIKDNGLSVYVSMPESKFGDDLLSSFSIDVPPLNICRRDVSWIRCKIISLTYSACSSSCIAPRTSHPPHSSTIMERCAMHALADQSMVILPMMKMRTRCTTSRVTL